MKPFFTKLSAALVLLTIALPPTLLPKDKRLSKDKQVLHALDRLTFGPRPGDVEAVNRMGLKKWIDRQLHPERIKESAVLETKLAPLESLRLTQDEAVRKYPPRQLIVAVANGRAPLPDDPVTRASVERLVAKYKAKRDGDEKAQSDELEPRKPLNEVLTATQLATLRRGTPEQRRELIASLHPSTLDDLIVALPPGQRQQLMGLVPAEVRRKVVMMNAPQQVVANDLFEGKIYRAIYSERQLEEVLADFWFNHFNVFLDKGADRFLTATYERDTIRPNVLGKFRDLLGATARSPAMLFYLDNWQSVAPQQANGRANRPQRQTRGLNENYARELMELHTLGVDGGYTQKDIVEVARCFTGWTIKNPRLGGGFEFNPRVHDKGEKVVLGETIPAGGGIEDGERVLDILSRNPSTAKFISRKLAVRFVADNPPASLIDRMAKTFAKSGGDLRVVMKTMIDSPEFWSETAYRAKVKTPLEMIISAVRALNADVDWATPLANQIAQLGQPLYRKVEPTGYSSLNAEWVNSAALLARMNVAIALAQNKLPGVKVDTSRFNEDPVLTAQAVMFQEVSPETGAAIQKSVAESGKRVTPELIAGLVLGSPEFQRR